MDKRTAVSGALERRYTIDRTWISLVFIGPKREGLHCHWRPHRGDDFEKPSEGVLDGSRWGSEPRFNPRPCPLLCYGHATLASYGCMGNSIQELGLLANKQIDLIRKILRPVKALKAVGNQMLG